MAANMSFPSVKHEIIPGQISFYIKIEQIKLKLLDKSNEISWTNPTNIQPNTNSAMLSDNSSLNVVF
jgi:hypothetical protein